MRCALKSFLLLALLLCRPSGLTLASPPPPAFTVSGAISGRTSHAPLAKAWVCLGRLKKDDLGKDTELLLTEFTAVADEKGNFQIKGVPAGTYALVYRPAAASGRAAAAKGGGKISVVKLSAFLRSFMPMIRDREVGLNQPFDERAWSSEFTLMKGHTLYCVPLGPQMKIWNASVRSGRQGPFLEMRKGNIWTQDIQKDTQLKLETWSF